MAKKIAKSQPSRKTPPKVKGKAARAAPVAVKTAPKLKLAGKSKAAPLPPAPVLKASVAPPKPKLPPADVKDSLLHLTDDDLKKIKTGLSRKDLEHYRDLLMQKRRELLGDVASLETDARNNSGGNLSNMPLHMADIGSDNYEQEFTLGLVESEQKLLLEINEALMRIRGGIFGVCLLKGIPISRARLDITPWARYCIEAAREMERRGRAG